jgi:uncharacterized membrane protein YoaT (DUF817 family)
VIVVFGRSSVAFTAVSTDGRLPLVFLLIGIFVSFAENISTFLGAWQSPDQQDGWRLVSLLKVSSWALLVIVTQGQARSLPLRR